jgi:hypothetical protein
LHHEEHEAHEEEGSERRGKKGIGGWRRYGDEEN